MNLKNEFFVMFQINLIHLGCTAKHCCGSPIDWEVYWEQLFPGQQEAWSILGWDKRNWDTSNYANLGKEDIFCWENGTERQLYALKTLCYTVQSWNQEMKKARGMTCRMYKR